MKLVGTADLAIRLTEALRAADNNPEADKITASWLKAQPGRSSLLELSGGIGAGEEGLRYCIPPIQDFAAINPNDAIALNNLAWVSRQLKDPKALEYAEKANELAPDNAGILDTLTELLLDTGEVSAQSNCSKGRLRLPQTMPTFGLNLARALIQDGNKESAKKELRILAKLGLKYPNQATVAKLMEGL